MAQNTWDLVTDLRLGRMTFARMVSFQGWSHTMTKNQETHLWFLDGLANLTTLQTALAPRFVYSTSNDDSPGGIGATEVELRGLGTDFEELVEIVVLQGTTPVQTSNDYVAINDLTVISSGSHLANVGDIMLEEGGPQSPVPSFGSAIESGISISRTGLYTVPRGMVAISDQIVVTSTHKANVKVKVYNPSKDTKYTAFDIFTEPGLVNFNPHSVATFSAGSRISADVVPDAKDAGVSINIALMEFSQARYGFEPRL